MDKPKTVVAIWETDFTQLYILIAAIVAVGCIAVVLTKKAGKKPKK